MCRCINCGVAFNPRSSTAQRRDPRGSRARARHCAGDVAGEPGDRASLVLVKPGGFEALPQETTALVDSLEQRIGRG